MTSDDYFTEDWTFIICNRTNRNKAVKYVGTHCHFMNISLGKLLVVKSKTVMTWKHSVPQIYKKTNFVHYKNALDMEKVY